MPSLLLQPLLNRLGDVLNLRRQDGCFLIPITLLLVKAPVTG